MHISKKTTLAILGIFMCCLALSMVTVPTTQAFIPLIVLGIICIAAGVGIIGYQLGQSTSRENLIQTTGFDYVRDMGISMGNLIAAVTNEYQNEYQLIQGTTNYFSRKAEYTAQYYVNESSYPAEKVLYYSGIQTEYENMTIGARDTMMSVIQHAENQTRHAFAEHDVSDYTIYALTEESFNETSGYYQLVTGEYYDLRTQDIGLKYQGECAAGGNMRMSGTHDWYSSYYVVPVGTELSYTIPLIATCHPDATTKITYTCQLELGNGTAVSNTISAINASLSGYYDGEFTGTLTSTNTETTVARLHLSVSNIFSQVYAPVPPFEPGTLWYMTGDAANFTLGASATLESNMPNLPVKLYIDDKEVLRLSYRYHESTYIEAASIDLKPLQSAYYDYTSLLNTQATNAISTGEVYWAALRALGYRDVSEVEALLPLPDLVLPDNIFDISTVDAIERYAMYIAYLRSLDDWFDNSTYADHISNMTIADVNFTSVPTIARGRIYDDSSAEWTEYLKTIWVIPETGSVTLHVGENNTLGVICNICYQVNSTGGIVYFYGQPNDLVEVTELYVRDTSGYYHNVTSTTITTTSLYTYTITYDENQGLDFPPPTLGEPNLIIILVVLIAGVYLLGQFAKGTGRRYRKYY